MESFSYPHFPSDVSSVHIALFTNVANAAQLKQRLISAASIPGPEGDLERAAVNFAFIDARVVCSLVHLQTAIYQAVLAHLYNTLRTRTIHSEILWALSPSSNITDAIRRYGVSESTKSLVVVRVGSPEDTLVQQHMSDAVSGDLNPLTALEDATNWTLVRKYNKITVADQKAPIDFDRMRDLVISMVAAKGVLA